MRSPNVLRRRVPKPRTDCSGPEKSCATALENAARSSAFSASSAEFGATGTDDPRGSAGAPAVTRSPHRVACEQFGDLIRRDRTRHIEALCDIAFQTAQNRELTRRLDALSDHDEVHPPSHFDQRADDRHVLLAAVKSGDEGPVDLEDVHGELL